MPEAKINWAYYDNLHPSYALEKLKRYIRDRQLLRPDTLEYWYVGQTDSPEDRLKQHQSDCAARRDPPWTDMFVVYGHRDIGFVTEVENGLIGYLRSRAARQGEEKRRLNAAGERYDGDRAFYVYVLVDDHPGRPSGAKQANRNAAPSFAAHHFFKESNKRSDAATRAQEVTKRFERAIQSDAAGPKRPVKYFYVGTTNMPARRYAEHQNKMTNEYGGDLWEQMRVIYQTPSLQNALDVETLLIDHALANYRDRTHNTERGRFASWHDRNEIPYFYVYYLEDRR